ncbi:putative casein kinase II subunit beta-2 [Smittium culicis]|uniref:Casein kinase II subunit beta n=1 Tax=Smittium culicis TaxID=133412 RepID=A0A1R1X0A3_9FUNG|nr:putative casein kinase II subunit beta-2 [Smittium culicis]
MVNYYNEALDIILDIENDDEDKLDKNELPIVEMSADVLYGLIHARYILTRAGLQQMAEKYENSEFGTCPRYNCNFTPVLPYGRSDQPDRDVVRLFCPNCLDIYNCASSKYSLVDSAYFGTTFAHLFFDTFPEFLPQNKISLYVPKMFGFKISEYSKTGSRMLWLRQQPEGFNRQGLITLSENESTVENAESNNATVELDNKQEQGHDI